MLVPSPAPARTGSLSRRRWLAHLGTCSLTVLSARSLLGSEPIPPANHSWSDSDVWSGKSLDGWMTIDGQNVPDGWQANDGMIFLRKQGTTGGHIVTRAEFGDFELRFQWKIAPGGNSGIKYRVRTYGDRTLGCEYQIYDPNGKPVDPNNKTAALYDLYAPSEKADARPAGEWNDAKIFVQDNRIEHWLNGVCVVSAMVGDAEWERRVAESKFNDVDGFSKNRMGRMMLTDHGSQVWYRDFEFRNLEPN